MAKAKNSCSFSLTDRKKKTLELKFTGVQTENQKVKHVAVKSNKHTLEIMEGGGKSAEE